jgi:site-specific recombinase XerD
VKKKLFELSSDGFRLPALIDMHGNVHSIRANEVPMMFWPDGSWCFEANGFIKSNFDKSLARSTLSTYAYNLSLFLRHCFNNNIQLAKITDNEFTFFIRCLMAERTQTSPSVNVRSPNQVREIGRICVEFLFYVGNLYCIENFIGINARIPLEKREVEIPNKYRNSGRSIKTVWWHRSFPQPSPKKSKLPVTAVNIKILREVIHNVSNKSFLKKRRYILIMLLENIGARRGEISNIKVESIYNANRMQYPEIEVNTLKQSTEKTRFIPVARSDISTLIEYIEKNRNPIVKKRTGSVKGDGYLLVSMRSGLKLRPNTITQEIHLLAKAGEIQEQIGPHLFRHRWITLAIIDELKDYNPKSFDDFRRKALDIHVLKEKLIQWTGHSKAESLDPYIHLAFEEISSRSSHSKTHSVKRSISSAIDIIEELQRERANKAVDGEELLIKIDALMKDLQADLEQRI